ncbi:hypothetical protein [Altererythrobacter sp. MF3-039]|uniref:hypothetical protein n=1 Tax=Altererythrobacter sp. MF3-039 TaxID=3252901 RepID=UPI00390CD1FA
MQKGITMSLRWPWLLGLLLGSAALALGLIQPLGEVEKWGLAASWTARVGFPLLIAAYIARPLTQLWKHDLPKALLKRRKWFGLGFATSHTIHLYALFTALAVAGQGMDLLTILGGGGAYAIMYVMAFTSNQRSMQALGKWWKRIHLVGIHWLWFIYAQSYFGRLFDPERQLVGAIGFSIAMAAALIRFLAWQEIRQRKRAKQPA